MPEIPPRYEFNNSSGSEWTPGLLSADRIGASPIVLSECQLRTLDQIRSGVAEPITQLSKDLGSVNSAIFAAAYPGLVRAADILSNGFQTCDVLDPANPACKTWIDAVAEATRQAIPTSTPSPAEVVGQVNEAASDIGMVFLGLLPIIIGAGVVLLRRRGFEQIYNELVYEPIEVRAQAYRNNPAMRRRFDRDGFGDILGSYNQSEDIEALRDKSRKHGLLGRTDVPKRSGPDVSHGPRIIDQGPPEHLKKGSGRRW